MWAMCFLRIETDLTVPNFSNTHLMSWGSSSRSVCGSKDWISSSAIGSISVYAVSSLSDILLYVDLGGEESMLFLDESPSSESLVVSSFKGSQIGYST